jgi:hypothetical protein
MQAVVTEEIRERSGVGRKLVEGEEDVQLVKDAIDNEAAAISTSRRVSFSPVAVTRPYQRLDMTSISDTLPVTELFRSQRQPIQPVNPGVKEFLRRPYHEFRANRFLFSCADEPDGYAQNRQSGWNYKLP